MWALASGVVGGGAWPGPRVRDVYHEVRVISPQTDSCHAMRFGASYVAIAALDCHHLVWAMGGHKQWPPHHDTNWYDPWPLPTGPAPTTFRSGEDRNHFCSMATTIPMIDFEPSPQPPSTPPNPTHTPTYTHRVMLWTYVGGQTTWLWIITTTTAATEPNAMVRF